MQKSAKKTKEMNTKITHPPPILGGVCNFETEIATLESGVMTEF